MKKILFILTLALSFLGWGQVLASDVSYTKQDSLIFEKYMKTFDSKKYLDTPTLTIETAKYFLGRPYTAHTLEINDTEKLVINLREFDCTTFVESCMALVRTLKSGDTSFNNFCEQLKGIRYRNGEITDYSSRLHYISDWAFEHSDTLEDISKSSGGQLTNKERNFMSKNSHLYKHLKNDPTNQKNIKYFEDQLNKREGYYVIQRSDIAQYAKNLNDGDIVVFATSIEGLDFTHIGFIYHENNVLKFIHASSTLKQTVIEKKSLREYSFQSKRCTGVMILRQKN